MTSSSKKSNEEGTSNFAKDVERATDPFMDRARQIKEEVNQATQDIKQNLQENQEVLQKKSEKLKEAGDRFRTDATRILGEDAHPNTSIINNNYSLRGRKLYFVLAGIVSIAILVVFSKNACVF